MSIVYLSYSYVEPGRPAAPCRPREPSSNLREYLGDHLDWLLRSARTRKSPPAELLTQDARSRFKVLETGAEKEFIAAAQETLDRLTANIDRRSKPGFFVAVRRRDDDIRPATVHAGVMKLDVSDKAAAAVMSRVDGEPSLEAFKGLLDTPGSLQKGAVYPDPRPSDESEIVIGDRQLTEAALYFLRTIDARQNADPGQATVQTIRAVREVAPDKAPAVATALIATAKAIAPAEFLDSNPDLLNQAEREQVLGRLVQGKRPVREIDPRRHAVQQEYTADGIVVRGRSDTVDDKVQVFSRQGGGWRIQIDVDEEPRRRYL